MKRYQSVNAVIRDVIGRKISCYVRRVTPVINNGNKTFVFYFSIYDATLKSIVFRDHPLNKRMLMHGQFIGQTTANWTHKFNTKH